MGDTFQINFDNTAYILIPGLIIDTTYSLQNVTDHQLQLLEQATEPDVTALGKRVNSTKTATIIKETNDIWIKSTISNGTAILNSVPIT